MALLGDIVTQGILTGSGTQDVLHTADGGSNSERVKITFRNYSGSNKTLSVFLNGIAEQNKWIDTVTLGNKERAEAEVDLGAGDDIRAEASAATAITYIVQSMVLN